MDNVPTSGVEVIAPPKPAVHKRRSRLALLVIVALLVVVGLIVTPSPFGPPATLHVWGKDFNSTGQPTCEDLDSACLEGLFAPVGPSLATSMTAQAMQQDAAQWGQTPVVVHQKPGILGWLLGMTDAGSKPSQRTDIYLQVGPDAFIRYVWAHCCMPDW